MISVRYGWLGYGMNSKHKHIEIFWKSRFVGSDFCFAFISQEELNDFLISKGKYSEARSAGFSSKLRTVEYTDIEFAELVLRYSVV